MRFAARVRSAVASAPPDLVHLDSLDLFHWAALPPVPLTCTHHSIESELLRRRAERAGPLAAWYLRRQASLIANVERDLCPTFALNLMMSDREADDLRGLAPTARTLVVPNGVDTAQLRPTGTRRDRSRLVFVGPAYVFANQDAIEYFLSTMWPAIRARVPDATVRPVGSRPSGSVSDWSAMAVWCAPGMSRTRSAELCRGVLGRVLRTEMLNPRQDRIGEGGPARHLNQSVRRRTGCRCPRASCRGRTGRCSLTPSGSTSIEVTGVPARSRQPRRSGLPSGCPTSSTLAPAGLIELAPRIRRDSTVRLSH